MGLSSSIGSILNKVTGATASAKQQNNFQKEFAKNAHQWEMEDLQKAGLNPALTATGGGGASAGGAGGTTGSSGINPIDAIGSMIGLSNQTRETNAMIDKIRAEIKNINATTDNVDEDTENKEWENKFWKWGEDGINWLKNLFNDKNDKPTNTPNSAKKKKKLDRNDLLGEYSNKK